MKHKNFKKIINNKGPAPYEAEGFHSGFVILFAVTISAILLSIAIGVINIALKEVEFGTSAKDTNEAFFAADTGIEYALFKDKSGAYSGASFWTETIGGLGSGMQSCVIVTVTKSSPPIATTFVSKGYNSGSGGSSPNWTCVPTSNSVERELDVNY